MKMAKASGRDIDAAGELMGLLDNIDRGHYPAADGDNGDGPTWFDEDDPEHLRALYDQIKAVLDKAPGFQGRVIGGMCYVVMYNKNEIVDQNADVLELHPRLQSALRDAERLDHLEKHVDPPDGRSWREYLDTAIAAIAAQSKEPKGASE